MKNSFKLCTLAASCFLLIACGSSDNGSTPQPTEKPAPQPSQSIGSIDLIARYQSGIFGKSAAEISDYHAASQRAFVVNAEDKSITVLDLSQLPNQKITGKNGFTLNNLKSHATKLDIGTELKPEGAAAFSVGAINSLSIVGDLLAIAVENKNAQQDGAILFYQIHQDGTVKKLHAVSAGAMPDMVKISPNGQYVLAANEGEPNQDYSHDPAGSITFIKINNNIPETTSQQLTFDNIHIPDDVIIKESIKKTAANPSADLGKDLEPEYIAISQDSKTAWVSLQENNAFAVIDLSAANPKISKVVGLGFKDHNLAQNKIDILDDGKGKLENIAGLYGIYMPDSIVAVNIAGQDYIVSANEGDGRDYQNYSNESKVKKIQDKLADNLAHMKNYPDLKIQTELGKNSAGLYEKLYAFGGRSFSIWDKNGKQVYDSGARIAEQVLKAVPDFLNSQKLLSDDRSPKKGTEPEAIEVAKIGSQVFAFVGLERQGGFMVFDISNVHDVQFIKYIHNRNYDKTLVTNKGKYTQEGMQKVGDLAPESIKYIAPQDNHLQKPLLIVANEVSGSTSVYQINLQ